MPTRNATRSASRAEDVVPTRTTRTTAKTAVTRGKKVEVEGNEDDVLAKEMDRVLKVSEPGPQARAVKPARVTASTSKDKEEKVPVKRTVAAPSRTAVKAPTSSAKASTASATATRRPVPRTTSASKPDEPTVALRTTTTTAATAKTAMSSRAVERKVPAATAQGPTTVKDSGTSKAAASAATARKPTTTSSSTAARSVSVTKPPIATSTSSRPTAAPTSVTPSSSAAKQLANKPAASAGPSRDPSVAPSAKTPSTSVVKLPTASTSRLPASSAKPAPSNPSSSGVSRTRPTVSLKGKEKEMVQFELSARDYPWMDTSNTLSLNERANGAMSAIKASLSSLGNAARLGYQYGKTIDEWSVERVDKEMSVCDAGLGILRDMNEKKQLGTKGIEVEKIGQAIISRSVSLGMPRRAFNQLAAARAGILLHYKHHDKPIPETSAPTASKESEPIPGKWLECCWLPAPDNEDDLSEAIRVVCVQQVTSAWSCLIGIEGYGYDLPPFTELIPRRTSKEWINPLQLGRNASPAAYCSSFFALTRRIQTIPMSAPHWSHVFVALISGYLTTVTDGDVDLPTGQKLKTPPQFWEFLQKWLVAYVPPANMDTDRIGNATMIIAETMRWAEEVIETRKESRQAWFTGKAFMEILGLWIDLARKNREPGHVEQALSLMVGSTSLGPQSADPSSATPVDHAADLKRTLAQLAVVETMLTENESPAVDKLRQALENVEWDAYGSAVGALETDTNSTEQFSRAYRYLERTRRLVLKLHNSDDGPARDACRRFLLSGVIAVAKALTRTPLVDAHEYGRFIESAIGGMVNVFGKLSPATNLAEINTLIDRSKRLSFLTKVMDSRATCLRCLGEALDLLAWRANKQGLHETGETVARQAVDIMEAAFESRKQGERAEAAQLDDAYKSHSRAYDTLGQCLLGLGKRDEAIISLTRALTRSVPSVYQHLEAADESATISSIFQPLAKFSVEKVTHALCGDLEPVGTEVVNRRHARFFEDLAKGDYSPKVRSLIAERIYESLLVRAAKHEALQLAYLVGEKIADMLSGECQAIRRLRVISRLMFLTSSSGIRQDDFGKLATDAESLIENIRTKSDADTVLTAEYHAIVLMLQVFQTYQTEDDPTRSVIPLATQAIYDLRQLLVPPSRSPKAATPAKKVSGTVRMPSKPIQASSSARSVSTTGQFGTAKGVIKKRRSSAVLVTEFDDIARLASMLASLVSLLGLLGHVMAQVEGIKVLRALLRYRGDMLNDYVAQSADLASLYSKLGKHTRAATVFSQALRTAADHPGQVSPATHVAVQLRHCEHLATLGEKELALKAYTSAEELYKTIVEPVAPNYRDRVATKVAEFQRLALANRALAAIRLSQDDAAAAIKHRKAVVQLISRSVNLLVLIATDQPKTKTKEDGDENPFKVAPPASDKTGANEPSKDAAMAGKTNVHPFTDKFTYGLHWKGADLVIEAYIDLANAYAQRGSAEDAHLYLRFAATTANAVKSAAVTARSATKLAYLRGRMGQLAEAQEKLGEASAALVLDDGPDAFDLQRVQGDILARRELANEANEVFEAASKGIHGLDTVFSAADALLPSPKKETLERASLSLSTIRNSKEPLLPSTLSQILRQQAWLFRESGLIKESDELYKQAQHLQSAGDSKAEESYLAGKMALDDAFNHFQSDLFMSSLTESTIAMPMGTPGRKVDHRQSTRHRIQVILEQADHAYQSALTLVAGSGKVEDVRQACLSLALLRAFQTSLGQGGGRVTSFAADLLASSTSIGLHRELLEAIEYKFIAPDDHALDWPTLDGSSIVNSSAKAIDPDAEEDVTTDPALVNYWNDVRTRHKARSYLSPDGPTYDLSVLPKTWAVVSISVTEDRNTMFISRHQNGHDPLVFCLPLDRQSKREGEEEDVFTFDAGIAERKAIIEQSDACSKVAKSLTTPEEKAEWWATKRALDVRMKELIDNVEYCWLGAFKTIFNPRYSLTPQRLELFRGKIEKVFNLALFGSAHDSKKHGKVQLSNALLECFATLSSKSRDEEIEDFIYFILDIYQFHGVPVAVSELDLDQVGIDVVTALTEMEASSKPIEESPDGPEHLLLALDKNVHSLPWESMPCLRGRAVSRVPSLPVLLDQVALGKIMQPGSTRRTVNSKKTHFILNPSGDLVKTQAAFEPFLKDMQERAGWKGVIGQKPSELEMTNILKDNELVLYFGHGGGEQYIRGAKVRALPKCATTFLWGCSSGALADQGELDSAGTAWNYMMAGCPALTGTLWDVTDMDIDRFTASVYDRLGLDPAHVIQQEKPRAENSKPGLLPLSNQGMGLSTVEAVNASRGVCKLPYLTGAAVVHYGIPVYVY